MMKFVLFSSQKRLPWEKLACTSIRSTYYTFGTTRYILLRWIRIRSVLRGRIRSKSVRIRNTALEPSEHNWERVFLFTLNLLRSWADHSNSPAHFFGPYILRFYLRDPALFLLRACMYCSSDNKKNAHDYVNFRWIATRGTDTTPWGGPWGAPE